ncbi:MAG: hypothetical protein INH41_19980 [Myxococcaceae bacterium]|nr:hypothetical protein [Myxococcaceae bacterium]MCA3014668.1 hypothetical protein [Myxococcaceae bacterium]
MSATEVGALQVRALGEETAALRHALRVFIGGLFDEDPDGPFTRAFYAAFCQRFAQRLLYATPVRQRARALFAQARIEEVGFPSAVVPSALSFMAAAEAFAVAELAHLARDTSKRRRTLEAIESRRSMASPSVWFAMISDWARINQHVLDLYGSDGLIGGGVGVLLVGTLNSGIRSEQDMRSRGRSVLSGLRHFEARPGVAPIRQAVMPANAGRFAGAVARALRRGARAAQRLGQRSRELMNLTEALPTPVEAGRLLGVDLLRFELAQAAAREFTEATDVSKSRFVFAASSSPPLSAVDLELQRNGARTIHLFHGGLGDDWVGASEHCSVIHGAWTENDRRCLASIRGNIMVGGMPVRLRVKQRTSRPQHVLVMSSYLHRDYSGVRDLELFERELVELMAQLRSNPTTRHLQVRWRPHPGSLDARLAPYVQRLTALGVEHLRGRSLEQDVGEADLVVSNMSTVIAESVLTGLPVFVHLMPLHWAAPASDFVHESRRFFHASDGHRLVERYLEQCKAGALDDGPEDYMLTQLFGPRRRPAPIDLNAVP